MTNRLKSFTVMGKINYYLINFYKGNSALGSLKILIFVVIYMKRSITKNNPHKKTENIYLCNSGEEGVPSSGNNNSEIHIR